jgi:hypothetical protein
MKKIYGMTTIHIEIGCFPGTIRPKVYLMDILKNLQKSNKPNIVSWAKNYIDNPPDCQTRFDDMDYFLEIEGNIKEEVQKFFKEKLVNLYYDGIIRYASW